MAKLSKQAVEALMALHEVLSEALSLGPASPPKVAEPKPKTPRKTPAKQPAKPTADAAPLTKKQQKVADYLAGKEFRCFATSARTWTWKASRRGSAWPSLGAERHHQADQGGGGGNRRLVNGPAGLQAKKTGRSSNRVISALNAYRIWGSTLGPINWPRPSN